MIKENGKAAKNALAQLNELELLMITNIDTNCAN
jgi:hypothetical protein